MAPARRWVRRPDGSNWGDFGPDDQIGRLNLVTPDCVKAAVAEVRVGKTFCLSLPLDFPGGNYHGLNRHAPKLEPMRRRDIDVYNYRRDETHTDVFSDDRVIMPCQASTQWDSLAHVGSAFDADGDGKAELVYYNGYRAGEHVVGWEDGGPEGRRFVGAKALGIENMARACVQGRGVMIDLFHHFGRARRIVGYDDVMKVMDADAVTVEPGDMVCIHTGQADALLALNRNPDTETLEHAFCHLDGLDKRLLRWIDESRLSVLVADNFAIEAVPGHHDNAPHALEPLHELCIFKLGINLGELWYLGELSEWLRAHKRSRFLLTAPPLRLPGAVGSPVTPIATV
ncbi:MAG: cyclase family protein [Rhodospirillales bacterium]|nr:cyclase family protein [Rhodospirillales bacterium]